MSLNHRSLRIVVVSQHVSLLHDISWVLEAVGYDVQTTSDFDENALWRRFSIADIVILDGRDIVEPTAADFAYDSDNPTYRVFLYDPARQTDFSAWYASGANDALRTPVSRGELLARVRTGVRYLEFERRLQKQSSRSAVQGMYSLHGLLRKLRKLSTSGDQGASQHSILMTAIDWFSGIRRKSGETASHFLANAAARSIKRTAGESSLSAYLSDGRFATLLIGQSQNSAKGVADALSKDFGSRESYNESFPRPSLTCAVVPWSDGINAESLLSDAQATLALAEQSGGGRTILHDEFQSEHVAWKEDISTGNLFANVVALDIMEPFPALLQHGTELSHVAEAFRGSGIPVLPYVDHDGRLIGCASDEKEAIDTHSGLLGDSCNRSVEEQETVPYDASFPEIYEAFSSSGCVTLVVTADERPLGYLTFDGFLSMIDPIHIESFAQTDTPTNELKYLVVPATVSEPKSEAVAI